VSLEPTTELARIAARHGAALVLMHCRGSMTNMPGFSRYADDGYGDVVADVAREWKAAADLAVAAGVPREDLVLDPGFGFAKNARQSLELCARLGELVDLGFPVLVGPSRKSFLAHAAGDAAAPPERRLGATIAAVLACAARGAAIVRVHDVEPVRQAIAFADALGSSEKRARDPRKALSFTEGEVPDA
jgi:dihydropteroate synthase